ncbi:Redox-sensitive transcriptional activator SoxR [Thalassocella blandensis]|nr:Redox-sensitive transcriptional activator SoxR [Thalassocella blandensis]
MDNTAKNALAIDIGQVAKATSLPPSTIRYYEDIGLIASIGRHGLRRQFSPSVLQRLALISLASTAGFSLEEIRTFFTEDNQHISRDKLNAKADELDRKIKHLAAMRDGLRHAAICKATSHFECPKFLRILKIAGKGGFKKLKNSHN